MNTAITQAKNAAEELRKRIDEKRRQWDEERQAVMRLQKDISADSPLVISFAGRFKSGKSSLINALLGTELLPTRATTATAVVTRIFYGDVERAYLCVNNETKETGVKEAQEIILNREVADDETVEVIFELPCPLLKGNVELRDTPGMMDSAQDGRLEKLALDAMFDTDLCVFVYDASSFISQRERMVTEEIYRRLGGNIVYAVNCKNRLNTEEDMEIVRDAADRFAKERKHPKCLGKSWTMCSKPGMIELEGFDVWLGELLGENNHVTHRAMRRNAARAQLAQKDSQISEEAEALKQELEAQLKELEDMHARALDDARRSAQKEINAWDLNMRVKAEQAKHRITDCTGLLEDIGELFTMGNWTTTYAEDSREVVAAFFVKRYTNLYQIIPELRSRPNPIRKIVMEFDFPSPTFEKKPGDAKAVAKGAAIGVVFGVLGMAAGGALARKFGGETVNTSASTTMNYVRLNIITKIQSAVETSINKIVEEKKRGRPALSSGLEDSRQSLSESLGKLNMCIARGTAAQA